MFSVTSHTGVTITLLALGAVFWLFARPISDGGVGRLRARNRRWLGAPMPPETDAERNDRRERDVATLQTIGNVLFLSGAALAVLLAWRVLL